MFLSTFTLELDIDSKLDNLGKSLDLRAALSFFIFGSEMNRIIPVLLLLLLLATLLISFDNTINLRLQSHLEELRGKRDSLFTELFVPSNPFSYLSNINGVWSNGKLVIKSAGKSDHALLKGSFKY
jgi:hypothetical protein